MTRTAWARFAFDYRSMPRRLVLWSALAMAVTSLPWIDEMARRVDVTCTWEKPADVPRCLVRTSGLFSTSEMVVYPTAGGPGGGWFAWPEHEFDRWPWRGVLFGDRIELADGCTAATFLSEVPSGTRREVAEAVAKLNRFFAEKSPEVHVSYGPWGLSPLLLLSPLCLAAAAIAGLLFLPRGAQKRRAVG